MAFINRLFQAYRTPSPFVVDVMGSVDIGASGAVGTQYGKGFSVSRVSAGVYTITVQSQGGFIAMLDCSANVLKDEGHQAIVSDFSLAAGTFRVETSVQGSDGSTNADPASGSRLCFRCTLQNRTPF
jgi:hypothetical protein